MIEFASENWKTTEDLNEKANFTLLLLEIHMKHMRKRFSDGHKRGRPLQKVELSAASTSHN